MGIKLRMRHKLPSLSGVFSKTKSLKELNFRNNKLESLPEDLFAELPQLSALDLSHNRFGLLSEAVSNQRRRGERVSQRDFSVTVDKEREGNFCR